MKTQQFIKREGECKYYPIKGYEFLNAAFLEAMNDIGSYGNDKYGADSFHQRQAAGDKSRGGLSRTDPQVIALHACDHFDAYLRGEIHDHFYTRKHQLAAVAFNAMMEFYFADIEDEEPNEEFAAAMPASDPPPVLA